MWIAPRAAPVESIVGELDLGDRLTWFTGELGSVDATERLLAQAYDLDEIAGGYRAFLDRWDRKDPVSDAPNVLVRRVVLHSEWLDLVRGDPRLPVELLPRDWPLARAVKVFNDLDRRLQGPADRLADTTLDTIPRPDADPPDVV